MAAPQMVEKKGSGSVMKKMAKQYGASSPTRKAVLRAKPDEFPLGVCEVCGEGRRSTWGDTCPQCGADISD